jgi:hypothetical protein
MTENEAIEKAISKWRENAKGFAASELLIGIENCPLCDLYYEKGCKGCPVVSTTGETECRKTPIAGLDDAFLKMLAEDDDSDFKQVSQEMVEFLETLLV